MGARLEGKTALITGAAEGLGKAVAVRFACEGARVILTDIQIDKGHAAAEEIGASAVFFPHDVALEADWVRVIAQAKEHFGRFDTLVNNAAISIKGDIEHSDFALWRRILSVNCDSAFLGCHYALPVLKENAQASIVNVTSALAVKAHIEMPAYSAAKAAMRQLNQSVALYCARSGYQVRCNTVRPGSIMTPMQAQVLAARGGDVGNQLATTVAQHPMGRIATADEVANAILFLASDEASFITGAEIAVDGGLTL